jgi:hypothetical protein
MVKRMREHVLALARGEILSGPGGSEELWAKLCDEWLTLMGHMPSGIWYLSFADGRGFLGGLFVRADDLSEALTRSHLLGLNPGGEVEGYHLPPEAVAELPSPWIEKLLSKADLVAFDIHMAARKAGKG